MITVPGRALAAVSVLCLATLLAGCGAPAEERPVDSPEPSSPSAPSPVAIAYDGQLGRQVCVPGGPNLCDSVVRDPDVNEPVEIGRNQTLLSLDVTLSWTATGVGDDMLALSLGRSRLDCVRCFKDINYVEGTSPVHLHLENVAPLPDAPLFSIHVFARSVSPGPAFTLVHEAIAFSVAGNATFAPETATPSA